ncbi:ATP-binding protein [Roseovarius sp. CAU 1744]|uniref:ATP-binding protein n=1 Tax=Roseovarius sp. CAU 1744 TaxID=3140368 RepID=UPI00325B9B12
MIRVSQDERSVQGEIVESAPNIGAIDEPLICDFPAALIVADMTDNCVVAESDMAVSLLGCTGPRIGQKLSQQWISQRDFDAFLSRFACSGNLNAVEVRLQKTDGTQFWCSVSARLIRISEHPHILLHMLDLSEQIAAREEISRQRDVLHSAEKLSALGQLLGGISHELNNPLSVLTGQALMLKEKATDDAMVKRADRILKAAGRCSRIVRSFLDLARGNPAKPVPSSLNDLVVQATEATIDTLRGAGIEVVLDLPRGLPRLCVDPDQIRQVIINLIENAGYALARITGPRRIVIVTRPDEATNVITLKISDTGPGVPSEISSRIFDPLFTTKGPDGGTGLGLALCRQIMEAHGGRIELENTSARGTVFRLCFDSLETARTAHCARREARSDANGRSLLILDDRSSEANRLMDTLCAEGHGVDLVESPFVGAEMLKRQPYDVILCRVGLANLSAQQCLRSLCEARPEAAMSLVFLLGSEADAAALDLLDRLERPYLLEPFEPRDIRDVLDLLSLRRAS